MDTNQMQGLTHVNTRLNYLVDKSEKPATYMYTPPPGTPRRSGHYDQFPMVIYDGRTIREHLSLDTNGFMLGQHETKVVNFYDVDEVRSVYYPEVEQLVKETTGATRAIVFDHNVRCATMAERGENSAQMPVLMAHNDYTLKSGPQRVRDLIGGEEAERLLQYRFMEVNVWRPIRGPVQASPLAVCDAQSMTLDDFVPTDLIYHDRIGEVYSVMHNPNHRWFYFPQMQKNEVLFLKGYDSATDGTARLTAHSAFEDPTMPPDAPARESIEARTLVFFAPEIDNTR
ncbi:MAG: CmcJ/NvfI family oxidoreductase [Candidatus Binatia bacterium]